jgi:protoporphyrinogen oxidase
MKLRVAVVGAGISGVSFARILSEKAQVTVFEQNQQIGGLINCERVNGYLYHRVGGHVFNSKNQQVLDWFWKFFDKDTEFIRAKRLAKIYIRDKFIGYPIEDHLFEFDKVTIKKIISELLSLKPIDSPSDFESFLKTNFGETLYQLYFRPYNEKMWNVDLSSVPLDWLEGKLPMPKLIDVFFNNILRQEEENMVHSFFFYPTHNGSQFIIDRLAEGLTINRNCVVNRIVIDDEKKIFINGIGPYDKMVYTGDVRKLPQLIGANLLLHEEGINSLRSNGTTNVLCSCDPNDLSWLYIPEKKFRAHRIIYTGNFSNSNNMPNTRPSCTVEFSNFVTQEQAIEEIKKLPGNLEFIAYNYEPNSYVIQDNRTRKVINDLKQHLQTQNICLLGRFAEWEYYNMDKAIEASFSLVKQFN